MIHPDEALRLVREAASPLPARSVPLAEACGLRLAQEVRADRAYPPFPRVMMDGYAVRLADSGGVVEVIGEVAAGHPATIGSEPPPGCCLEVMTGAACPPWAEAVVPKENTQRTGPLVRLPHHIAPGAHVAAVGTDCAAAAPVLRPGDLITPMAVAAMASFGLNSVRVIPRPSLAIITTGAELVAPGPSSSPYQIRDSNGPMLAAAARAMGLDAPLRAHAYDRPQSIREALERAGDRDLILLTGGVSAGAYDLVPGVLRDFGAETLFHKVNQKPGKPLLFARKGDRLIFGLPGNPLACFLGLARYAAAALRGLAGGSPVPGPQFGRLASPIRYRGRRTFFCLAQTSGGGPSGWAITPLPSSGPADIFGPCGANCLVALPEDVEEYPAGAIVPFEWAIPTVP